MRRRADAAANVNVKVIAAAGARTNWPSHRRACSTRAARSGINHRQQTMEESSHERVSEHGTSHRLRPGRPGAGHQRPRRPVQTGSARVYQGVGLVDHHRTRRHDLGRRGQVRQMGMPGRKHDGDERQPVGEPEPALHPGERRDAEERGAGRPQLRHRTRPEGRRRGRRALQGQLPHRERVLG